MTEAGGSNGTGHETPEAGERRHESRADAPAPGSSLGPAQLAHAAGRGAIAAMAMSGMRTFTQEAGLVEKTPPQAIFGEKAPGILQRVPRGRRRATIELFHWGYGAGGGVGFGVLPDGIRRRAWAGPVYGLALWLGFELGLAPLLGLSHSRGNRPVARAALAADHVLYGLVLSETHRRARA